MVYDAALRRHRCVRSWIKSSVANTQQLTPLFAISLQTAGYERGYLAHWKNNAHGAPSISGRPIKKGIYSHKYRCVNWREQTLAWNLCERRKPFQHLGDIF